MVRFPEANDRIWVVHISVECQVVTQIYFTQQCRLSKFSHNSIEHVIYFVVQTIRLMYTYILSENIILPFYRKTFF